VRADAFICTKREPTHRAHSYFSLVLLLLNYLYSVRLLCLVGALRFCGCKLVLNARTEIAAFSQQEENTIQSITWQFPGRKLRPVYCSCAIFITNYTRNHAKCQWQVDCSSRYPNLAFIFTLADLFYRRVSI